MGTITSITGLTKALLEVEEVKVQISITPVLPQMVQTKTILAEKTQSMDLMEAKVQISTLSTTTIISSIITTVILTKTRVW